MKILVYMVLVVVSNLAIGLLLAASVISYLRYRIKGGLYIPMWLNDKILNNSFYVIAFVLCVAWNIYVLPVVVDQLIKYSKQEHEVVVYEPCEKSINGIEVEKNNHN
jgi:hypothetical protein